MKLHELSDNPGAAKPKKRRARGPGSGKGKTAGRGIKGQTSRSGVAINAYEGGQMPLYRRLPKRGFNPVSSRNFAVINLQTLQRAVDRGAIAAGAAVDEASLVAAGVVRRALDGVRLLAKGELTVPLTITVAGASKAAVEAVEKAGGRVDVIDIVAKRRADARAARTAE
jgi:large subunit ribosomal protein L15